MYQGAVGGSSQSLGNPLYESIGSLAEPRYEIPVPEYEEPPQAAPMQKKNLDLVDLQKSGMFEPPPPYEAEPRYTSGTVGAAAAGSSASISRAPSVRPPPPPPKPRNMSIQR